MTTTTAAVEAPAEAEPITVQARRRDGWVSGTDGRRLQDSPHFTNTTSRAEIHLPPIPDHADAEAEGEAAKLAPAVGPLWLARLQVNLLSLRSNPAATLMWAAGDVVPQTVRQTYWFTEDGQPCRYGPDAHYEVAGHWLPESWHRDVWLAGMARRRAEDRRQARAMAQREAAREERAANDLTGFRPTIRERQLAAWIKQQQDAS